MLRLTTLGATDLRDRHGRPLRDVLAQPKRVALLVYLALESRGGSVARDKVLAMFWPEADEAHARNALSQALHHLRQELGAEVIESRGATSVAVEPSRLWCDAVAFLDAVEHGDAELALDLYRGDLCPALLVGAAPDFDPWLDQHRRRLRRMVIGLAGTRAQQLCQSGDQDGARRFAKRALTLRPEEEADVRAMLALLDQAGDGTGALFAYDEYARRLQTELEMAPDPQTRTLADDIRRRRARAEATATPAEPDVAVPVASMPAAAPPWRKRIIAVAALLTLGTLGTAAAWLRYARPGEASPAQTLAVFPFPVRGGPGYEYLGEGLVDLLSAKLEGAAGLHAIDPRSIIAASQNEGPGAAPATLARLLGAGRYITGTVVEAGGRLEVHAALYGIERSSSPLALVTLSGDTAAVLSLVDALAGRLLASLEPGRDTALTSLAALTTSSLPALKAFLDGERALRAGLDGRAAAGFREAATLDTGFALAKYRLAVVSTWVIVRDAEDPSVWAAAAARQAGKLTPLARDLLIAYRAYKDPQTGDSERLYRSITISHPDNVEAWLMLGETRFHYNAYRGRSMMEGWEPFSRALVLEPFNAHAMIHLARMAAADGRIEELDSLARSFYERHHDAERLLEMRALAAFTRDDSAATAAIIAEAREADDLVLSSITQAAASFAENLDAAGRLAAFAGAPSRDAVVRVTAERIGSDVPIASGRWSAADGNAAPGRLWAVESEALVAADPFFPVRRERIAALRDRARAPARWPAMGGTTISAVTSPPGEAMRAYLVGRLSVRLGDAPAAEAALATLERSAGADSSRAQPRELAAALRGAMARARGDSRAAIRELERLDIARMGRGGRGDLAHWGLAERFARAELLHGLGRDQEALPLYESIVGVYDLPFAAAAHFRRGEIHQRLGDRERARFHYQRFIRLWRDADPEFQPLVARARQALDRLAT